MELTAIYAHLSCSDLERSKEWFGQLFGRQPDAAPMIGLVEWHHSTSAGLQLYRAPQAAGSGTLTLIVNDINAEFRRVQAAGLSPGPVEGANYTSILRLLDPDGNLVVLAQLISSGGVMPFEASDT